MRDAPGSEAPTELTTKQVHAEFEKLLRDRTHMGLRNLLGGLLLEPRNPFQKTRRRPKKWVVTLAGTCLLGLLIVCYFHLR